MSATQDRVDPVGGDSRQLLQDLGVGTSRSSRYVKRMIRVGKKMESREVAAALDHRAKLVEMSQLVAGALEKEHRNRDIGQMCGPIVRRPARRVQREPEEDEPDDAG